AMEGCDVSELKDVIGRPFDEALQAQAQAATGAKSVRVIRPGQMVSMDYVPDRLNLELDAQDKVVSARCG
ncbi:MAG TPA: I78 family peptidase inhibitor, partial [Sphingomonas sp.]|nr:I78 family peptidase inhibitor [Sphingomonas sp.]